MSSFVIQIVAACFATTLLLMPGPAGAQSGERPPAAAAPAQQGDRAGPTRRRIDEIAEVAKSLVGPAANPECVWLGRRIVGLMWRDDLDTAFRHLDLYDRFGCPGGHIQATFRCLVRHGDIDPKAPDSLNNRVQACWINPALEPTSAAPTEAAAAAPPPPASAAPAKR
ncbi:MAG: beta-1-3, beta-1-6-glucan biosynthesis protein [Proteobacteria bacterium]|nr:beta-1-3, beta-1-6-glucan biosynthesis protein [Pseudomonadota bacterium]